MPNLPDLVEQEDQEEDDVPDEVFQKLTSMGRRTSLAHTSSHIAQRDSGLLQSASTSLGRTASHIAASGSGLMASQAGVSLVDMSTSESTRDGKGKGGRMREKSYEGSLYYGDAPSRRSSVSHGPAFSSGLTPVAVAPDALPVGMTTSGGELGSMKAGPRPVIAEHGETLLASPTVSRIHSASAPRKSAIRVTEEGIPEQLAAAIAEAERQEERERLAAARSAANSGPPSRVASAAKSRPGSVAPYMRGGSGQSALGRIIEPDMFLLHEHSLISERLYSIDKIRRRRKTAAEPDPATYSPWPATWNSRREVEEQRSKAGRLDLQTDDWDRHTLPRLPNYDKGPLGPATYVPTHYGTVDKTLQNQVSVVLRSVIPRFPKPQIGSVDNDDVAPGAYELEPQTIAHGFKPWIVQVHPYLGRILKSSDNIKWEPPMKRVKDLSSRPAAPRTEPVISAQGRRKPEVHLK
ncbi:hypothetical protein HDU85_004190 [Gaertneriomyces sp. JEL0708]|nr:hypothetical protein HDU85_004190 [Gaertneriomyces sp. JEL0708]